MDDIDHERLVKFAATIVGQQDADDVVQDTYLKLLSAKVAPFRRESDRYTWLKAVVKYTAFKRVRERLREQAFAETSHAAASYEPNYDDLLDAKRHIAQLSSEDQAVLTVYAQHGSYRCVAQALRLTRSQVRGRLYRARRRLRERLA